MVIREDEKDWGHSGTPPESRCCYTLRLGCRKNNSFERLNAYSQIWSQKIIKTEKRCTKMTPSLQYQSCIMPYGWFMYLQESQRKQRHWILTLNKNTALLWCRINEDDFLVKSLSHKNMEPHLDAAFEDCAEIQKYFPSREGTGNKNGAFGNTFQNE